MAEIAPRIKSFQQLGFGLFIHFGLYSQHGEGEWYWNHHKVEREEYLKFFDTFTAADFDAQAWVAMAQQAGCKYVCLTTRHHEGFSLYDTQGLNTYDAPHAPLCGRDLVKEFSDACDDAGMGKFFYHTTLDWWHEDFDREGGWSQYQQYLRDSVQILCENYGRVDGLWFDGNWAGKHLDWEEDALYGLIRKAQPECIIVNNSSIGNLGQSGHPETDICTYEQGIPTGDANSGASDDKIRAGEMCDTMNSHWGIGAHDLSYQSPAHVIEKLVACRRYQANLLMNIGPTADGGIPGYEGEVFKLIGRWTSLNKAALYQAVPTKLECRRNDFVLQDGNDYYYFCHNVAITQNRHLLRGEPGDGLQTIRGALPAVKSISWVDNNEELTFEQNGEHFMFEATPYPYGSQLVVRIAKITV